MTCKPMGEGFYPRGSGDEMNIEHLKENVIVRGPLFPESVQVIVTIPMGQSVKLVGKGLDSGQVYTDRKFDSA